MCLLVFIYDILACKSCFSSEDPKSHKKLQNLTSREEILHSMTIVILKNYE